MSRYILKVNSSPNSITIVEQWIQTVANEHRVKEEKYPNILISLTEAVNNAIIHGNNSDETKHVNIYLEKNKDGLAFKVCDQGHGFDPNDVPDPTCPENIECCGGRGVFLIKQLCDQVDYLDNGSTVKMHFHFCCS